MIDPYEVNIRSKVTNINRGPVKMTLKHHAKLQINASYCFGTFMFMFSDSLTYSTLYQKKKRPSFVNYIITLRLILIHSTHIVS